MMARKFSELEARMPAASRQRAQAKAQRMLAELLLPEIRHLTGMTQVELARALGIKQPTLSRLEAQGDMQVSTLKRIVEALGGELDIVVHLPAGDYRLGQFKPAPTVAEAPAKYASRKPASK
jgi:transcriptional regulator with XRE-family HTH domain